MVISGGGVGPPPHKTPHVNLSPFIQEPAPVLPRPLTRPCWRELDGAQWGETLGGEGKHGPVDRSGGGLGGALLSCARFHLTLPLARQLLLLIHSSFIPRALEPR